MSFANPKMFWLLLATVLLLSLFFWWSWHKRKALVAQFVQSRLLLQLSVGASPRLRMIRILLAMAIVVLLILALARPQMGFRMEEAVYEGLDIIIAIDTSRSMLATDITPNRMSRAKFAALDLQRLASRARFGLVAFAGTAFLQCPLTTDIDAFRESLNALDIGIIPQGGTVIAEAITVSKKAFDAQSKSEKVVVLISDGEDHEPGAVETAHLASLSGLRLFTIGVGTQDGELLPWTGANGEQTFVKDTAGNVVKSRLNESLLTQIAQAARGFYLPLDSPGTLETLYRHGLATLPKHPISGPAFKQVRERFQWLVGLAILLLVIEVLLNEKTLKRPEPATCISKAPTALLGAFFLLIALGAANQATASPRSALRDYRDGRYGAAQTAFEKMLEEKPEDFTLHYNAGTAAYQMGAFGQAIRHFSFSMTSPDLALQQRSYYNLGNSFYRLGQTLKDLPRRRAAWGQALQTYEASLKLDANDADAQSNAQFLRQRLQELDQQTGESKSSAETPDKGKPETTGNQKPDSPKTPPQNDPSDPPPGESEDPAGQKPPRPSEPSEHTNGPEKNEGKPQASENGNSGDIRSSDQKQPVPDSSASAVGDLPNSLSEAPRMTLDQAQRLLDAHKPSEKAMLFAPDESRSAPRKPVKDW